MSKPISVVVADPSECFRQLLSERINAESDMFVAASAGNGLEVSELVSRLQPDVLITELLLREMEGLALIRLLREKGELPRTIVLSSHFDKQAAETVGELGVEHFFSKPCRLPGLIEAVRELPGGEKERSLQEYFRRLALERAVDEAMVQSGVMPYLRGRDYLKAALMAAAEDRSLLSGVTKVLYPELARRFSTSPGNLERCIRSAIEIAWRDGDRAKREAYFGPELAPILGKKPGNTKYMRLVIDRLGKSANSPQY